MRQNRNRILVLIIGLWMSSFTFGQSSLFHFIDTTAVIAVSTSQSPAHWYIEIYNDANTDTLLRWKTRFENIPSTWNINFNDQHTNHPTINDGDSADLVLLKDVFGAQKLIIGAEINQEPGWGIVYFTIYNPYAPLERQNIEYHFRVGELGLEESKIDGFFLFENDMISNTEGQKMNLLFYDEMGRILGTTDNQAEYTLDLVPEATFIVVVEAGKRRLIWKIIR